MGGRLVSRHAALFLFSPGWRFLPRMALIRPGPLRQGALAPDAAKGAAASPIQLAERVQRRAERIQRLTMRMQWRAVRLQPVFAGTQDLAVPQADKS